MRGPPNKNPLSYVLSAVFGENAHVRILTYDNKQIFADLWLNGLNCEAPEIGGQRLCWDDPNTIVLIIGEAPPDELFADIPESLRGINCRDHLTAFSWAAAWRLRHPGSPVRLAILGGQAGDPRGNTPSSLATLFCADVCPERPFVPRIAFFNGFHLEAVVGWMGMEEERGEYVVWPTLPVLRSCIWEGFVSTREQHHAISNVLGAFLLAAQVHEKQKDQASPSIQDFLIALIQTVGIDAGPLRHEEIRRPQPERWVEPALRAQLKGAVLLDDMADLWESFLRGALGYLGNEGAFVSTPRGKFLDELGKLPARLAAFLDSGRNRLSAGDIIAGQHKIGEHFVLFLDLRLFPDPESLPSGGTVEQVRSSFISGLAEFGLKLLDSGRNLPWINNKAKARLRTELRRFQSDASRQPRRHPLASKLPPEETLLPRLLSLLDPTLPIVIFSSTHHTELALKA